MVATIFVRRPGMASRYVAASAATVRADLGRQPRAAPPAHRGVERGGAASTLAARSVRTTSTWTPPAASASRDRRADVVVTARAVTP